MAELNLKQIVDKLNTEFIGEHRKLVFWYDDAADFAEDTPSVTKKPVAKKAAATKQNIKKQTTQAQNRTAASKMNEQKGPVPSKRRRRQPSVSNG